MEAREGCPGIPAGPGRPAKSRVSGRKAGLPSVRDVPSARERVMSPNTVAEVRFRFHTHHHNHHALVAVSRLDGRGIGAARCIRHEHDPESAEVEVSVDEEWQGRGIGAELLRRLTEYASSPGVRRIVVAPPAPATPATMAVAVH